MMSRPMEIGAAAVAIGAGGAYAMVQILADDGGLAAAASYSLLLVILAAAVAIVWGRCSVSARVRRRVDLLEIPLYLSLTGVFLIGLFGLPVFWDETLLMPTLGPDDMPGGLMLSIVAIVSIWLGYATGTIGMKRSPRTQAPDDSRFTPRFVAALAIYVAVVAVRVGLLAQGEGEHYRATRQFGDYQQLLIYTIELRWFFLAMTQYEAFRGKWPMPAAVAITVLEAGMSLAAGWTSGLLKVSIITMAMLGYAQRQIAARVAIVSLVGVAVMMPVAREMRKTYSVDAQTTVAQFRAAVSGSRQDYVGSLTGLLFRRQSAVAQTPSLIMALTPRVVPYRPLSELLAIPVSFVPRFVWPNKPAFSETTGDLSRAYFGVEGSGSSAPTLAGSAYLYGGVVPVLILAPLLGLLAAGLYRTLVLPGFDGRPVLIPIYAAIVIGTFQVGEGDLIAVWQGIVQRAFVFGAVAVLVTLLPHLIRLTARRKAPNRVAPMRPLVH
jgi:hypothetical protein